MSRERTENSDQREKRGSDRRKKGKSALYFFGSLSDIRAGVSSSDRRSLKGPLSRLSLEGNRVGSI